MSTVESVALITAVVAAGGLLLTAVLAAATIYYARQTKFMVNEMRRARGATLRPNVAVTVRHLGAAQMFVILTNVGAGPALEVDLVLKYEPNGPNHKWGASVLSVGERARFFHRDLKQTCERIVMRGSCKDALGEEVEIAGEVLLKEYWELSAEAQLLLEDDLQEKTTGELEKIRRSLEKLATEAERASRERQLREFRKGAVATTNKPADVSDIPTNLPSPARKSRPHRGKSPQ